MNKFYLAKLVRQFADEYRIDPRYFACIIWQESRGNPYAYRFEPFFLKKYIADRPRKEIGGYWPETISEDSERVARSTSWGLVQIMGQVARERGFSGECLTELIVPKINLEYGAKHFRICLDKAGKVQAPNRYFYALTRWNGSEEYAKEVQEHIRNGRYKRILVD